MRGQKRCRQHEIYRQKQGAEGLRSLKSATSQRAKLCSSNRQESRRGKEPGAGLLLQASCAGPPGMPRRGRTERRGFYLFQLRCRSVSHFFLKEVSSIRTADNPKAEETRAELKEPSPGGPARPLRLQSFLGRED